MGVYCKIASCAVVIIENLLLLLPTKLFCPLLKNVYSLKVRIILKLLSKIYVSFILSLTFVLFFLFFLTIWSYKILKQVCF